MAPERQFIDSAAQYDEAIDAATSTGVLLRFRKAKRHSPSAK